MVELQVTKKKNKKQGEEEEEEEEEEEMPPTRSGENLDAYDILGVDRHATMIEVKRAYRKCAQLWHPDKHAYKGKAEREIAEMEFKKIHAAFRYIKSGGREKLNVTNGGYAEWAAEEEWVANMSKTMTPAQTRKYLAFLAGSSMVFAYLWTSFIGEKVGARMADLKEEREELLSKYGTPSLASSYISPEGFRTKSFREHTQQLRDWRNVHDEVEVERRQAIRKSKVLDQAYQKAMLGAVAYGSGAAAIICGFKGAEMMGWISLKYVPKTLKSPAAVALYTSCVGTVGFFVTGHQTASPRGRYHVVVAVEDE